MSVGISVGNPVEGDWIASLFEQETCESDIEKYFENFTAYTTEAEIYEPAEPRPKREVLKLGGSVLRNERDYREWARTIVELAESRETIYIVVSAKKGDTNDLINEIFPDIHYDASDEDGPKKLEAHTLMSKDASNVEEKDIRLLLTKKEIRRVAEHLIEGEIKSARMLGDALRELGVEYEVWDQKHKYPIVAPEAAINGSPDEEASEANAKRMIRNAPKIVVVAGYGAKSQDDNSVALLGRNSSDRIAALLGKLINADYVTYVKDVPGIYENPNDPSSKRDEMSVGEILNLSDSPLDQRCLSYITEETRHRVTDKSLSGGTVIVMDKNSTFAMPKQQAYVVAV